MKHPEIKGDVEQDPQCQGGEYEVALEVRQDGRIGAIRHIGNPPCRPLQQAIQDAAAAYVCHSNDGSVRSGWVHQRFKFVFGSQTTISDEEARAEYDAVASKLKGQQEYLVRHILTPSQAEAAEALNRIRQGASFDLVANALSRDEGSASNGGNLGWSRFEFFHPDFATAMKALAPKGLSAEPVHSPFGWHVIEVQQVRPLAFPEYEQVRDRIKQSIQKKRQGKAP